MTINPNGNQWRQSVSQTAENIKGKEHLYGSSSITKGTENLKGAKNFGKYLGKIFENFTNTLHLKFVRIVNLFSQGEWVNNKTAYNELHSRVSELTTLLEKEKITAEEREDINLGIGEMREVCTLLRKAKGKNQNEGKNILAVESKLVKLERNAKLEKKERSPVPFEVRKGESKVPHEEERGSSPIRHERQAGKSHSPEGDAKSSRAVEKTARKHEQRLGPEKRYVLSDSSESSNGEVSSDADVRSSRKDAHRRANATKAKEAKNKLTEAQQKIKAAPGGGQIVVSGERSSSSERSSSPERKEQLPEKKANSEAKAKSTPKLRSFEAQQKLRSFDAQQKIKAAPGGGQMVVFEERSSSPERSRTPVRDRTQEKGSFENARAHYKGSDSKLKQYKRSEVKAKDDSAVPSHSRKEIEKQRAKTTDDIPKKEQYKFTHADDMAKDVPNWRKHHEKGREQDAVHLNQHLHAKQFERESELDNLRSSSQGHVKETRTALQAKHGWDKVDGKKISRDQAFREGVKKLRREERESLDPKPLSSQRKADVNYELNASREQKLKGKIERNFKKLINEFSKERNYMTNGPFGDDGKYSLEELLSEKGKQYLNEVSVKESASKNEIQTKVKNTIDIIKETLENNGLNNSAVNHYINKLEAGLAGLEILSKDNVVRERIHEKLELCMDMINENKDIQFSSDDARHFSEIAKKDFRGLSWKEINKDVKAVLEISEKAMNKSDGLKKVAEDFIKSARTQLEDMLDELKAVESKS